MDDNLYESSQRETRATPRPWKSSWWRGALAILPVGWLFALDASDIGSDFVQFSLPVAWGFTIGTLIACGLLAYAVRGWWQLLAIPVWLLLLLNLVVLWYWNV
jgi:hypothetical protein